MADEIRATLEAAAAYAASNRSEPQQRQQLLRSLNAAESRLSSEIEQRSTITPAQLAAQEANAIDAKRKTAYENPALERAYNVQNANKAEFEDLRRVNGGGFPRNISPVLYIIPLLLVGIAEWYVNFSTFAAMFIPVFAIAATIIVAVVFAWASHMHGAYLKQISEIMHPSVEYRNVLGRKLALIIATVLLVAAFGTVVWLRYLVISEQLGGESGIQGGVFGGAPTSMIWSKVGPTIVLNILIWGLGTLYSWAMHEKVPGLREAYRNYAKASKAVEKKLRPFYAEEKQLKAKYEREREKNAVAANEAKTLLDDVRSAIERLRENKVT
jgi:hypothetical protein